MDDFADDDDSDDDIDDYDVEDDDEEPTVACPYCRREIHEDAQRCPYCEKYISAEDAPGARKPWWIIAGVIVCLYVLLRLIVG
jgi:DNA-directed RNA polymerase subunit RPC12/RpoP